MSRTLLIALVGVAACGGHMSTGSTTGKIVYKTERVPNPSYGGGSGGTPEYSDTLDALIVRDNAPVTSTVYFDGTHSRVEEINFDYGVKGPAFRLREAGRGGALYCKEFPHVHFCVQEPVMYPLTGPSPILALTDERATVAGFPCRKATYNNLTNTRQIFFTEQVHVDDPTGAVYRIDGVPGLIVQWHIDVDASSATIEQTTAVEVKLGPVDPALFALPAGFRKMASVDEARAEERRLLDAEAAKHPATAEQRAKFVGTWRLSTAPDDIEVEIVPDGDAYVFRTTEQGKTSDERGVMKGDALQVDDPPNFRLYRVSGDQLVLVGSDAWRYKRR